MAEVRATPARVALMRAIEDGAVSKYHSGIDRRPRFEVNLVKAGWPVSATSRGYRHVTAEVTLFCNASMCVSGGLSVELTDRGRAWLKLRADHG